jgi:hypothetical protein
MSSESSSSLPSEFALTGKHVNVAMMTSGGLAPCLSSSIAQLIHHWVLAYRSSNKISGLSFRMYVGGYRGILTNDSFLVPEAEWETTPAMLNALGGSPIGNSRVKVRVRFLQSILPFLCFILMPSLSIVLLYMSLLVVLSLCTC